MQYQKGLQCIEGCFILLAVVIFVVRIYARKHKCLANSLWRATFLFPVGARRLYTVC